MSKGIIRRIDSLGRIVIPKEIRKSLKIGIGDLLDIYLNNEEILLKKYSSLSPKEEFITKYIDVIKKTIKKHLIITDKEKIIMGSNVYMDKYKDKNISQYLLSLLDKRKKVVEKNYVDLKLTNNMKETCSYIINQISDEGDVIGLIILISKDKVVNENDELIIDIGTNMIINSN